MYEIQSNSASRLAWPWLPATCDFPGLIQSVSFRLFDSVPETVIERWTCELEAARERNLRAELCAKIERYADMGYGSSFLAKTEIAELVENAVLRFDGEAYDALAWCVMPNHVHTLFVPRIGHSMSQILQSWKSFTSHIANKLLNLKGEFWFPDYFDEFMKSTQQLEATIEYIELNPVNARLILSPEQWRFSSAAIFHTERVRANRLKFPEVDITQLPHF